MTPESCPQCGAEVARGARACPECGADERTGWSEDASADRLGIPREGDFDYEEFVRDEFGEGRRSRTGPGGRMWWWVAVGLLLALLAWWVF